MSLRFTKAHSLGNDFVILKEEYPGQFDNLDLNLTSQFLGNRKYGIGCDQIIWILNNNYLRFFNLDGSEANTCGNGTRAAALYLNETQILHTKGGDVECKIVSKTAGNGIVEAKFPPPKEIKEVNLEGEWLFKPVIVDVGNLHLVLFPKTFMKAEVFGERFADASCNVSFVNVLSLKLLYLSVYELGALTTNCCGSAALASVTVAKMHNVVDDKVIVRQRGGDLIVEASQSFARVTGMSSLLFSGEIAVPKYLLSF